MPQLTEQSEKKSPAQNDFLPIHGTDHVEFYVGNAKQAAYFYRVCMGFALVAYRGPETGARDRVSYVLEQDKIRSSSPAHCSHPVRLPITCSVMAME